MSTPDAPREGLILTLDRDGWTKRHQLSLCLTVNGEEQHGIRLAGPKYNGSSTPLQTKVLTQHDADQIRQMLDRVFPRTEP